MRKFSALVAILALALGDGSSLRAGDCYRVRTRYVAPHKAFIQTVAVYPVYYQVGQEIRNDAIAELTAKKVQAYWQADKQQLKNSILEELRLSGKICVEFGSNSAGGAATSGGNSSTPAPAPAGDHSAAQLVFNESCISCHTGATAKGGLDLSDLSRLPAAKLQKAALRAYTGSMPPQPAQPIAQEKADALLKWAEKLPAQ